MVVKDFALKSAIPVIHSWQKDQGCRIPQSRNRAIAKSNYEYIIMIDGDTVLHRDFVKDHKEFARRKVYIQGSRALLQPKFTGEILTKQIFRIPSFFSKDVKNRINMLRIPFLSITLNNIFATSS